ncbi:MBL fold metallo-hydrolase [Halorarum salinum]|uniref:MBL fold metallo-hydrolase n=1 Tax=Halorarum salinum TaxID=2743089 RepID=A0A7D5LBF2_9EURY|nr:MBL fold metallo-hydrolase [Halobaculum salinum]QLG62095.1 MBL fold metallo-hydrolase [Halobaculum salinum]
MTHEEELDPETLARRLRAGESVSILDVRNRDEYETWRVEGRSVTDAQVPHVKFVAAGATGDPADLLPDDLTDPVVSVCPRGEASTEVAGLLREAGVDAVNLAGGMTAWARTYLAAELDAGDATVLQYQRPSSGCLAYLVVSGGEAAVVDPLRAFADRYVEDADERGATLRYALDTHVHADHVSGVRAVAERTDAEVALPDGAAERGLAFDARLVGDGEELQVGDATLAAIHAPGHTSELTAFALRGGRGDGGGRDGDGGGSGRNGDGDEAAPDVLFTGDALFLRSVGRPDLERGDEAAREYAVLAHDTLHDRLLALPDDTLVAPGHYADHADARGDAYAAPLGDLRGMDVLQLDEDAFVDRVASDLPPRPSNYERIIATNLGRESMDDEAAFEAELGPNNCAVSAG